MRTTVDIHDELLARAKQFAATCNKRLADVVNDALQETLDRVEQSAATKEPFHLMTYGSGGVRPGIDLSDHDSIQNALDGSVRDPITGLRSFDQLR